MKVRILVAIVVLWSAGALAQQTTPAPLRKSSRVPSKTAHIPILKPATVSGYVFALTRGGDIKPARMAKVYMLYSRPEDKPSTQLVERASGAIYATDEFRKDQLNEDDKEKAWEAADPALTDSTKCRAKLLHVSQGAIVDVLNWGNEHKGQFVFGDTDEDGKFEITIPKPDAEDATFEPALREPAPDGKIVYAPGVYLIVVIGSAGYNDAFWENEVTVRPGEQIKVKMSEPTKACLRSDSE
jgi:hypothetical protein